LLQVVAPDSKCDHLGLVVWDEPAAQQSEASVLNLKLRAMSKATSVQVSWFFLICRNGGLRADWQPQTVFTIEQASKNPQKVSNWINKIAEVHREKPPATMNYSRPMPDIDFLMQAWTPEFEEALKKVGSFVQVDWERCVCANKTPTERFTFGRAGHLLVQLHPRSLRHFGHSSTRACD